MKNEHNAFNSNSHLQNTRAKSKKSYLITKVFLLVSPYKHVLVSDRNTQHLRVNYIGIITNSNLCNKFTQRQNY